MKQIHWISSNYKKVKNKNCKCACDYINESNFSIRSSVLLLQYIFTIKQCVNLQYVILLNIKSVHKSIFYQIFLLFSAFLKFNTVLFY